MGQYCYTTIDITYYDNAEEKDIKTFIEELEKNTELTTEIKDVSYIEISSGRVPNLAYQLNVLTDIVKKHKCVRAINGSAFVELDMGVYMDKEEDENDRQ